MSSNSRARRRTPLPITDESPRPSIARAERIFGPGVSDASTLKGVAALARSRPKNWDRDLRAWTGGLGGQPLRAPLAVVLASSINQRAIPRSPDHLDRIRQPRASSRRLSLLRGDRPLLDLDSQRELDLLLTDLLQQDYSGSTSRRTVSYLRCLLRDCYAAAGLTSKTSSAPSGPRRRVGRVASRLVTSPQQIAAVLPELPLAHRAAVALAAAAGLLESEILGLRRGDLRDQVVVVRIGGIRGRAGHKCDRIEAVAAWAWPVLLQYLQSLPAGPTSQLLFPNRTDPSRPRTSFGPLIRKTASRVLGAGATVTLAGCRRLWQRIQIDLHMPSAQVRQSWSTELVRAQSPSWWRGAVKAADSWRQLCAPPVRLTGRALTVPRRKPKGCKPGQPEATCPRTGRVKPPVPDSCRLFTHPPPGPAPVREQAEASLLSLAGSGAAEVPVLRDRARGRPPGRPGSGQWGPPSESVLTELHDLLVDLRAGRAEGWAARDVRRLERAMTQVTDRLKHLEARLEAATGPSRGVQLLLAALAAGAGYGIVEANQDEIRKLSASLLQRLRRLPDDDDVDEPPWLTG